MKASLIRKYHIINLPYSTLKGLLPPLQSLGVVVVVVVVVVGAGVGGTTTFPLAIALVVATVVAVTVAAVGLRLGTLTVMPRLLAFAATAVFADVNAAVLVIVAGVIAPAELTAETGTALIRANTKPAASARQSKAFSQSRGRSKEEMAGVSDDLSPHSMARLRLSFFLMKYQRMAPT